MPPLFLLTEPCFQSGGKELISNDTEIIPREN